MEAQDTTESPVDPWAAVEARLMGEIGGSKEEAVDNEGDGPAEDVESDEGEPLAEGEFGNTLGVGR